MTGTELLLDARRKTWWWLRFVGHAILQRDFADDRVQRLVRQHFREFYRG